MSLLLLAYTAAALHLRPIPELKEGQQEQQEAAAEQFMNVLNNAQLETMTKSSINTKGMDSNSNSKEAVTDLAKDEVLYSDKVLSEDEVKAKLQNSTVVFMLPMKGSRAKTVPYIRANIEKIGAMFKYFDVVVGSPGGEFEQQAQEWNEEAQAGKCTQPVCHNSGLFGPKKYQVMLTTEEKNSKVDCNKWVFWNLVGKVQKPCKIAKGRDAILKALPKNKYDFAIAVDSDMGKQWSTKSFLKAFSLDGDWAMVGANGVASDSKEHQDWFAFNSNKRYPLHTSFGSDDPAFQVKGAFGGVAIYRLNKLEGCSYTSCFNGCEHNCLSQCLVKKGEKLYMHPGFVVEWPIYKINGHTATELQRSEEAAESWKSSEPAHSFKGYIKKCVGSWVWCGAPGPGGGH